MANATKQIANVLLLSILLLTSVVSAGLARQTESGTSSSPASFELEPNDVTGKADWLYAGKDAYGKIGASGDVDFWKIKAPAHGTLNVWLGDLPGGRDYNLYVYDSEERQLGKSERSGSAEETVEGIVTEKSAWYYVAVRGNGDNADRKTYYHLKTEFLPSGIDGKSDVYEPNNTISDSHKMGGGATIEGTLHNAEDVDFYRFDVKLASTIEVELHDLPENMDLDLYLYDKNQKQVAKSEKAKNADEAITYNGDPGPYYVKVSRDRHSPLTPTAYKLDVQINTMPVILIPGIGGSRLDVRENGKVSEVWLDVEGVISEFAESTQRRVLSLRPIMEGSEKVVPRVEGIEVFPEQHDDEFRAIEFLAYTDSDLIKKLTEQYYSMAQHLQGMGYQKNKTLFALPYDWRYSNSDNAKRLKAKMDEALKKSQAKQVQLVAHSMGGLLVKETFLTNPSYQSKARKIIYLGTPFLGAPLAYQAIKFGYNFGIPLLRPETGRIISEYSPAVHELLPSREYANHNSFLKLLFEEKSRPFSYEEFLKDPRIRLPYDPLVRLSEKQHVKWDNKTIHVPQYSIVGEGNVTLLGYEYNQFNKLLTPYYDKANGDGTVPFASANYGQKDIKKRFYVKEEHSKLMRNPYVIQQVAHLLLGIDAVQSGLRPTPQTSHPYDYYLIYRKDGKFPEVSVKKSGRTFQLSEKTGEEWNNLRFEYHGNVIVVHVPQGEQLLFQSGKTLRAFGDSGTIIQHFSSKNSKSMKQ
jgi:pimeloyl-ACP methyl ester carboxylesterase